MAKGKYLMHIQDERQLTINALDSFCNVDHSEVLIIWTTTENEDIVHRGSN